MTLFFRQWIFPCGGGTATCTTQDAYARFQYGPRPGCPEFENPSPVIPEGTCALSDDVCGFSTEAPTCVSWVPECATDYSCTTQAEYDDRTKGTCPNFRIPPPTPAGVCVADGSECKLHNPCTIWQGHCNGAYICGSQLEFAKFINGPIPFCAAPDPLNPRPLPPLPEGECLYRDGQCEWSQCRAWLDGCGRRWNCGTEYEFQVFQAQPLPPCANPGPFFVPPIQPGQCVFDAELGECAFNGEGEASCIYWCGLPNLNDV
jgi:hypothetical protein